MKIENKLKKLIEETNDIEYKMCLLYLTDRLAFKVYTFGDHSQISRTLHILDRIK